MHRNNIRIPAFAFIVPILFLWPARGRTPATKNPYPAMAPLDEYLMPDEKAEIALARSSAPPSISDAADVMVLRRDGYKTAVKGSNGFVCIVERSWAKKTNLVLAGRSKAQILAATKSALETKELPALAPGAMCYMMGKQQYLNDDGTNWHPHVMFFVSGDAAKSWVANLPGSPVIAASDPEARVTVFMVLVGKWSDGTPGPSTIH